VEILSIFQKISVGATRLRSRNPKRPKLGFLLSTRALFKYRIYTAYIFETVFLHHFLHCSKLLHLNPTIIHTASWMADHHHTAQSIIHLSYPVPPLPDPETNCCFNRRPIALPNDGILNMTDYRKSAVHSSNFLAGVKVPVLSGFPIGSTVDPFDIIDAINHVSIRYMLDSAN